MQQTIIAVVYETASGVIQYSILSGNGALPPLGTPPWQGGETPEIQTFSGASQPPDQQTALGYVVNLPPWSNSSVPLPGGLAILAAPANFDPSSWFQWKISGGALIEKTQVRLRVSGNQIYADDPINSTIQIGNPANSGGAFTISMTNGVAELPGPPPTGTPVFVSKLDPIFWSDPDLFS